MVIRWSIPAREDLRLIHQYIAHDSRRYAKRVIQEIAEKVNTLVELPHLGRVVPEIGEDNVREISMYSYSHHVRSDERRSRHSRHHPQATTLQAG